ncbi:hypothetical protein KM043_018458 [Ampulex compressa]|nr:hypothetical protein KM043_018458 [Ampulex compressa]
MEAARRILLRPAPSRLDAQPVPQQEEKSPGERREMARYFSPTGRQEGSRSSFYDNTSALRARGQRGTFKKSSSTLPTEGSWAEASIYETVTRGVDDEFLRPGPVIELVTPTRKVSTTSPKAEIFQEFETSHRVHCPRQPLIRTSPRLIKSLITISLP